MSNINRIFELERRQLIKEWAPLCHRGYSPYLVCACKIGYEWPGIFVKQIQQSEARDRQGDVWRIISRSPVDPEYLMMYALPRLQKRSVD